MQLHKLAYSYMSLHAVLFFVWAAHKNFAVLVLLHPVESSNEEEVTIDETSYWDFVENVILLQIKLRLD